MDVAIAEVAARHHGVVALAQLVALGLNPSPTRGAREMAAVRASRGPLSYRSAGDWLGIRPTSRATIPCTTLGQTVLDLCEVVRPFEVRKAITRAERLGIFDLTDVQRRLTASNGRRGAPILHSLLGDFQPVETESATEDLLFELCEANDLPRPEEQYWIGDRYGSDFAWPKQRVIAEVDDWQSHGTRTAFEKDRRRVQDLMPEWRVVPITYRQLANEPDRIAAVLRRLLTP